jgi:predicted glutamine amidotransferase
MCGISGIINGSSHRGVNMSISNLAKDMAIANAVRGLDATGVMQKDKKAMYYHKKALSGSAFVQDKDAMNYFNDADNSWFTVIHNRAATEGKVSDDNSHPFSALSEDNGYIVGVHNGTLTNCWKTDKGGFEVDSEWAMQQLADHKADALGKMAGAFAFVWHDDRDNKVLQIARNDARPLFFAYQKGTQRMFFASEHMMLAWLADRNRIDIEDEIYEITPYRHYQFNVDNPREFSKTPFKVAGYSSTTISPTAARDSYTRRFKAALEEQPVVPLTPAGPIPLTPGGNARVTAILLTPAERDRAIAAGVSGKTVEARAEYYDNTTMELWCTFNDESGDLQSALIRRVSKATYDSWSVATSLATHIVGITDGPIMGDDTYILSRTVGLGVPEEEKVDLNSMAAAIEEAINQFQSEKKDDQIEQNAGYAG